MHVVQADALYQPIAIPSQYESKRYDQEEMRERKDRQQK